MESTIRGSVQKDAAIFIAAPTAPSVVLDQPYGIPYFAPEFPAATVAKPIRSPGATSSPRDTTAVGSTEPEPDTDEDDDAEADGDTDADEALAPAFPNQYPPTHDTTTINSTSQARTTRGPRTSPPPPSLSLSSFRSKYCTLITALPPNRDS